MVSADKFIIFQGDAFRVRYESLEADPLDTNGYNFTKSEYIPDSAYVQVWNVTAQAFLELDGPDSDRAEADVDDNIISFLLESQFTQQTGSYKMFVTAVYPDGQEVTQMQTIKVSPRG